MMAVKCLCFAKFVILRLARKQFVTWGRINKQTEKYWI